jgi:hypothetical protein
MVGAGFFDPYLGPVAWDDDNEWWTFDGGPIDGRPLAPGRRNRHQIAGDGGLHSAAVLLSAAASARRHGVNPWDYVQRIFTASAAHPRAADFSDLLPKARVKTGANSLPTPNLSNDRPRTPSKP